MFGAYIFFRNILSIVSIDSTPIHIDNNTLFNCIFFISFFFTLFKCKKNCFGLVKILSKFCVCFNFVNVVVYFHRNNSYSNNIKHKTQTYILFANIFHIYLTIIFDSMIIPNQKKNNTKLIPIIHFYYTRFSFAFTYSKTFIEKKVTHQI